jgi:YYY domain-containing protein
VLAAAELLLAALVFGSLYAVNTLDFPTAVVLLIGGSALWATATTSRRAVWTSVAWLVALVGLALLLFAPFIAHYSPTSKGIALVRDHEPFTRFFGDLGLIYLVPLWVVGAAVAARLAAPFKYVAWTGVALLVVLVLLAPDHLAGLFLVVSVAAVAVYAAFDSGLRVAERFFWLLVAVGFGLIGLTDFAYIRDVFDGTPSYRFNTVFKAGYQAWFLLAIAATCGLFWNGRWLRRRRLLTAWRAGLVVAVALLAVYPVAGSYARTRGFEERPTLDGLRWLTQRDRGDVEAIRWLRSHVDGAPTILEAVGPDFSPQGHARVSTFTGLPTVLGWAGHELQWGHQPGRRGDDVQTIYRTRDLDRARALLERYGVRYVFVGGLERDAYGPDALQKFARLGTPVYSAGGTTIYRVGRASS